MIKRRKINKKGQLLLVGLFFLLMGILIVAYVPIKTLKNRVFDEIKLAIYQDDINEDNDTIQNVETKDIEQKNNQTDNNQTTPSNTQTTKPVSYTYVGQLSIPKIRFKRGFVKKE